MMDHSEGVLFQCPECPQKFRKPCLLVKHAKLKHGANLTKQESNEQKTGNENQEKKLEISEVTQEVGSNLFKTIEFFWLIKSEFDLSLPKYFKHSFLMYESNTLLNLEPFLMGG